MLALRVCVRVRNTHGLGLLVEDGLGLTTVTALLPVVTTLTLGRKRVLALLVLGNLVGGVLLASLVLAVSAAGPAMVSDWEKGASKKSWRDVVKGGCNAPDVQTARGLLIPACSRRSSESSFNAVVVSLCSAETHLGMLTILSGESQQE